MTMATGKRRSIYEETYSEKRDRTLSRQARERIHAHERELELQREKNRGLVEQERARGEAEVDVVREKDRSFRRQARRFPNLVGAKTSRTRGTGTSAGGAADDLVGAKGITTETKALQLAEKQMEGKFTPIKTLTETGEEIISGYKMGDRTLTPAQFASYRQKLTKNIMSTFFGGTGGKTTAPPGPASGFATWKDSSGVNRRFGYAGGSFGELTPSPADRSVMDRALRTGKTTRATGSSINPSAPSPASATLKKPPGENLIRKPTIAESVVDFDRRMGNFLFNTRPNSPAGLVKRGARAMGLLKGFKEKDIERRPDPLFIDQY